MLPKSYRLSRPDLLVLKKNGLRKTFSLGTIITRKNEKGHLRVGVEISTKVDKRATTRNHLRRQIYEFMKNPPFLKNPQDLLVIIKPGINTDALDPTALNNLQLS